jgi:2-amino-4-hydroxy-6-hydroxymethyldihydropteridine diphosphokinase
VTERVYVALGSNVGNRAEHLRFGRAELSSLPETVFVRVSSIEETDAIGPVPQERYLNQMVLLQTELSPRELLESCHAIERRAGRVHAARWGPRTLDLDIVRFGDLESTERDLVIPHPEIPNRDFWQAEIAELEPYARE